MENNEPIVSICIPTTEMRGNGVKFIKDLFESIEKQTYKNTEIIISDQSLNDDVKNYVFNFQNSSNLVTKYFRDESGKRNLSANLNNAMNNASGEYFKLIGQDDVFAGPRAIEIMVQKIQGYNWLASSCAHFKDDIRVINNYHLATWPGKSITSGNNLVGAVSVIMLKRTEARFDENLIWLLDCEFYYRISLSIGLPICIEEPLILIRRWDGSITSSVDIKAVERKEYEYVKEKKELDL